MLRKITLINFMSHEMTVIEPADGLTVIAGENNCGKSAIVSAIQCVCFNATGNYMVRHGEKECRVIIETDDGHVVEWKRSSRKVSYIVDGETIDRTQGKVPEKVEQVLRMGKVKAENEEFDVHFADQKKPVFLLDGTAGQRAAFFASSSDAAKLIEMQSLHKSKLGDAQKQVKNQQRRENQLLGRIETLKPLESIQEEMVVAEQQAAEIKQSELRIQTLAQIFESIGLASRQADQFQKTSNALNQLGSQPDFANTTSLSELHEQMELASLMQVNTSRTLDTLQRLSTSPEMAQTGRIEDLIVELGDLRKRSAAIVAVSHHLKMPVVPNIEGSLSRIDNGNEWSADIARLKSEIGLLEKSLSQIPQLSPVSTNPKSEELAKQIVAQTQAQAELDELNKAVQEAIKLTESAHNDLHLALEASGTCPTCGQELNLLRSSA